MADTTLDEWVKFLRDAGIRDNIALQYASSFFQNRIQLSMVLDLNRDVLRELGVTAIGDAIAILKHAKAYHEQSTHLKILKSVSSDISARTLPGFDNRILPVIDKTSISLNIRRNEGPSSSSSSHDTSPVRGHYHSNAAIVPGNSFTMIKEDLSDMRQPVEDPLPSALLVRDRSSEKYKSAETSQTNINPNSTRLGYLHKEVPLVTSPSHNSPEISFNTVQNRDPVEHSYDAHLVSRSQRSGQQLCSDQPRLSEIPTKQENTTLGHISATSNVGNRGLGIKIPVQQSYVTNVSLPQQFAVRTMKRTHSSAADPQSSNYILEHGSPDDEANVEIPQRIKRFAILPHGISQEEEQNEPNGYATSLSANNDKNSSYKSVNPTTVQSNRQHMNAMFNTDENPRVGPDSSALKKGLFTAERKRDSQSLSQLQGPLNSQQSFQMQRMSQMQEHPSSQLQKVMPKSRSRIQTSRSHSQHRSSLEQDHGSNLFKALSLEGGHVQRDAQQVQSQTQGVTMRSDRPANFTVKVNGLGVRKIKKTPIKLQQAQAKTAFYGSELSGRNTQAGGINHQIITMPSGDYHNATLVSDNAEGSRQSGKTKLCNDRLEMLEDVADTSYQNNGSSTDWEEYQEDIPVTQDSTCDSDSGDVPSQIEKNISIGLQNEIELDRVPGQIFSRLGMKVESPSPRHYAKKSAVKNNALENSTVQRVVKLNPKKLKILKQAQSSTTVAGRKLNQKAVVKKKVLRVPSQKSSNTETQHVTDGETQRILHVSQKKLKPRGILKPKTSESELSQEQPQRMTANLLLESVAISTPENEDTVSDFQVDEDSFASFPSETEEESFNYQSADENTNHTDAEFSEIPSNSAIGSKNVRFGPVCVKEFQKTIPPSSPANGRPLAFRRFGGRQKQILS